MMDENNNGKSASQVGRLVRSIHFHRTNGGWVYVAFGSWQPFKWLMHGGWICLSLKWIWRFAVVVPRMRGWRWG